MKLTLPEIFKAEKRVSGPIEWGDVSPFQEGFEAPLEILSGATLEGLRLRVKAPIFASEIDYTIQLEYAPNEKKKDGQIDRIDWRPYHAHNNYARGPAELRGVLIEICHHHTFEWNWYPAESRMLRSNLPIAILLDPIESSKQLLNFAAEYYRIENLRVPDRPPRQGKLF